jgi:antitoxin (DNA-binding transcriptional repressor) of toxin-antitoxin stability system
MRAVALAILQSKLSEYVHLAQEGETVLVTDRDQVIARLVPPLEQRPVGSGQSGLKNAIQKGWITPPARRGPNGQPPRLPTARWDELAKELDEDRGER